MEPHSQHFFSEEKSLVLRGLRTLINGEKLPQTSGLQKTPLEGLRWDFILRICEDHRLLPFLALALLKEGILSKLPLKIRSLSEYSIQSAVLKNLIKRTEFNKINGVLEEQKIPIIPLKGIALTQLIYREFPVRQMEDLDLLVKEEDLEEARSALFSSGFLLKEGEYRWQTKYYDELLGRSTFERDKLVIDLQWSPRFFMGGHWVAWNAREAWQCAEPYPALGKNVFLLPGRETAWHLLLQIANDFETHRLSLSQVYDLAWTMKKCHVGPQDLLNHKEAERHPSLKQRLETFLQIIEECLFEDRDYVELSQKTCEILEFLFKRISNAPQVFAGRSILKLLPSPRDKIIFLTGYLFPSKSSLRSGEKIKGIEIMVRYLRHWGRLLMKGFAWMASIKNPFSSAFEAPTKRGFEIIN